MGDEPVSYSIPKELDSILNRAFSFYKNQRKTELEGLKINNQNNLNQAMARKNAGGGDETQKFIVTIAELDRMLTELETVTPMQWMFQEFAQRIGQLLDMEYQNSGSMKEVQDLIRSKEQERETERKALDATFLSSLKKLG